MVQATNQRATCRYYRIIAVTTFSAPLSSRGRGLSKLSFDGQHLAEKAVAERDNFDTDVLSSAEHVCQKFNVKAPVSPCKVYEKFATHDLTSVQQLVNDTIMVARNVGHSYVNIATCNITKGKKSCMKPTAIVNEFHHTLCPNIYTSDFITDSSSVKYIEPHLLSQ